MSAVATPLVLSAVLVAGGGREPALRSQECGFSVVADGREPEVVGPPEIVARTRVLAQPDSPLVIRRVDLSDLDLSFGGSGADTDGFWTVDVQNVSNQVVHDGVVRIQIGNARGHFGGGPAWKGPLGPGDTVRLRAPSHGQGVDPTASMENTLELLVIVESVQLPGCFYKPSQAIPRAGPGRR